jgi:hypothetical protein
MRLAVLVLVSLLALVSCQQDACDVLLSELRYPCECSAEEGPKREDVQLDLNCDHVVFGADFPILPYGAPIRSFSQRYAGYQALPTQVRYLVKMYRYFRVQALAFV